MEPLKDEAKTEQEKKNEIAFAASLEDRKKAAAAWAELNKRREREGKKELTPEQKKTQEALIKQGKTPDDVKKIVEQNDIKNLSTEESKGIVEDIARNIKTYIDAGAVTKRDIEKNQDVIKAWVRSGKLSEQAAEDLFQDLGRYADEAIRRETAAIARMQDLERAKKILEKAKNNEELTDEEKDLLEKFALELGISNGGDMEPPDSSQTAVSSGGEEEPNKSNISELELEWKRALVRAEADAKGEDLTDEQIDARAKSYSAAKKAKLSPIATFSEILEKVKTIEELEAYLSNPNSFLRRELTSLLRGLSSAKSEDQAKAESEQRIEEAIEAVKEVRENGGGIREGIEAVRKPVSEYFDKTHREKRGYSPYESINEIARDIMTMTGGDFGRDGKYALLKTEAGREVFQQQNFLKWVRDRLTYYADQDPDNQVDFYSKIAVVGGYKNTTILEMLDNDAMFTDKEEGKLLSGLKEQVLYEVWLFKDAHDIDALYRRIRDNTTDLPKTLGDIYKRNTFTKLGTMDKILTLIGTDTTSNKDFKDKATMRRNQKAGQALRTALLSYYHLPDTGVINNIEENSGLERGNSALTSNKVAMELYIKQQLGEKRAGEGEEDFKKREREAIFSALKTFGLTEKFLSPDKRGFTEEYLTKLHANKEEYDRDYKAVVETTLKDIATYEEWKRTGVWPAEWPPGKETTFTEAVNVFNKSMKDAGLVADARERMRLFTMQTIEGVSYDEARYAEFFAYSMTRWTGLAAKNDTSATGFDAWTKVLKTQEYRERQANSSRGGLHGNPYTLGGFKQMGVDFFVGVKDMEGKSILEIIQGGQGDEVSGLKENIQAETRFGEDVMNHFGGDHIQKAFSLFGDIVESREFNFDSFVTINQWGDLVIEEDKANKFMDSQVKAFRYAYSTWDGTDYSKVIRVRQKDGSYQDMELGEAMWGKEVYADFVDKRSEEIQNTDGSKRGQTIGEVMEKYRSELFKRPLMYAIAAEMYAHTERKTGYKRYKTADVEKIYEFLQHFAGDITIDDETLYNSKRTGHFFSKDDISWIRMHSRTGVWRMYWREYSSETLGGLWDGGLKAMSKFFSSLDKTI